MNGVGDESGGVVLASEHLMELDSQAANRSYQQQSENPSIH